MNRLTPKRVEELIDMAVDVLLNTEHFHPIIWKEYLDGRLVSLEEIYWMRDNLDMEVEVTYDGDGSP